MQWAIRVDLGQVERVVYMTAAMTGMRQGELLALRWVHVDWVARRIRVRLKAPDLRGL